MKKTLQYYLHLPYKIEIESIPEEEGGGCIARLPQFGRLGIIGDGETPEEAVRDLNKNKEIRFKQYLDEGLAVPEPETEDKEYSGEFIVHVPKFLHKELHSQEVISIHKCQG
jgi:predicted RNase H-like HicB family nuclease